MKAEVSAARSDGRRLARSMAAGVGALALAWAAGTARAGLPAYTLVGGFDLPTGTASYDVLPDGTVLALAGRTIYRQVSVEGGFVEAGRLPEGAVASYGASFLRVSPDGLHAAAGNNLLGSAARVHTFDVAGLSPGVDAEIRSFAADNTDAQWADNDTLFVTGTPGASSVVTRIETAGPGSSAVVVSNIGGSAGGIVTRGGYLFTGNGFDFAPGGSDVGEVRAFALDAIDALTPGTSIDFEASGVAVADALSGAALAFDALGNLLVGGGDIFGGSGDFGSLAVVDGDALVAALGGGGPVPDAFELRLTPLDAGYSYFARVNPATSRVYVTWFDNTTFAAGDRVLVYEVPAPGAAALLLAAAGSAGRRRRGRGS
ncbi:MAG: hypothetical protein SFZ24_10460 [Planctomycetota bacterium]|nr:hypothetical protein [Planctomycetota bacterium]